MAIDTPQAIVAVRCPSFATDPRLDDIIELAKFYVAEKVFGDAWNLALALVVCHILGIESDNQGSSSGGGSHAVGGIKTKKEGNLSISYSGMLGDISGNRIFWMSTPAGQELMALWDAYVFSARNRFV